VLRRTVVVVVVVADGAVGAALSVTLDGRVLSGRQAIGGAGLQRRGNSVVVVVVVACGVGGGGGRRWTDCSGCNAGRLHARRVARYSR